MLRKGWRLCPLMVQEKERKLLVVAQARWARMQMEMHNVRSRVDEQFQEARKRFENKN